jgi:hypothetical protein
MEWQPIETAPLDHPLMVAEGQAVGEAHHCGRDGWYWAGNDPTDSWGGQIYPTHWMPLPTPPQNALEPK